MHVHDLWLIVSADEWRESTKCGKDKKVQFGQIKKIWWLGEGLGLKMLFLDRVTIGWDDCFGPGEYEDESTCIEGDEPKVYKISWLDGEEDSVEFGNKWIGDEVCGDVDVDIGEDKFWGVVGKEEAGEVGFEFWDIDVGMVTGVGSKAIWWWVICIWFEVRPGGCMHVGGYWRERRHGCKGRRIRKKCMCLEVCSFLVLKL